ncbi:MAG TPA: hypothetical protein VKA84_15035 [Gemmatimonadaceae bacterium]|nr:hypothetical protein [Gemmatimonadaceae bacterium]
MPSVTTWMRLEPRVRNADMSTGLQARVYDPLWLLARQWQFGEFQAEDNGSPAAARWRGEVSRLNRYYAGPLAGVAEGQRFDGDSMPLETVVERERVRPNPTDLEKLRLAAEAGHQFLRMLEQQTTSKSYRDAFKAKYPFAPLRPEERGALDADTLSFLDLVMPRVPDGRKLYAALGPALRPFGGLRGSLPADPPIAAADVAEVTLASTWWLQWYESLISEPADGGNAAWSAERMEYTFSVGTRMAAGERVLTAREYYSGRTDWHDFDLYVGGTLRGELDPPGTVVTQTVVPAPVSYRGMPAARFWEFEDAQVDFGAIKAGPEDLARMLLVEFAISYGNDWFVMPVELPVGSLSSTSSLVVTNTFGERFVIKPSAEAGAQFSSWRMFQLTQTFAPIHEHVASDASLFLLPPALVKTVEGRPIEEVLFLRDEMANMAWGVERVIESTSERPLDRFEQQRYVVTPASEQTSDTLAYRLSTDVPDYWIPLLPVQSPSGLRLRRGMLLKADGSQELIRARGRILVPDPASGDGLSIFEEEIPREGIRVTRNYQLARWQDGSTHLWIGRRKAVGSGEGSSGLQFDTAKAGPAPASGAPGTPGAPAPAG